MIFITRAAFVASCFRGVLPPVDFRAVCFVRAIATDRKEFFILFYFFFLALVFFFLIYFFFINTFIPRTLKQITRIPLQIVFTSTVTTYRTFSFLQTST